jgi:hypothetical protein
MLQLHPAQHNILSEDCTNFGELAWVPVLRLSSPYLRPQRTSACRVGGPACCPLHLTFTTGSCGPVVKGSGTYRVPESCSVRALCECCCHPVRFLLADTSWKGLVAGRQYTYLGPRGSVAKTARSTTHAARPYTLEPLCCLSARQERIRTNSGASCISFKA